MVKFIAVFASVLVYHLENFALADLASEVKHGPAHRLIGDVDPGQNAIEPAVEGFGAVEHVLARLAILSHLLDKDGIRTSFG